MHPGSSAGAFAHEACKGLTQVVQLPLLSLDLASPVDLGFCSPGTSGLVWMLMNNILLGCLLPLRLAYLAERGMKQTWLMASAGLGCSPADGRLAMLLLELRLLMVLALLALVLTLGLMELPMFDTASCEQLWAASR